MSLADQANNNNNRTRRLNFPTHGTIPSATSISYAPPTPQGVGIGNSSSYHSGLSSAEDEHDGQTPTNYQKMSSVGSYASNPQTPPAYSYITSDTDDSYDVHDTYEFKKPSSRRINREDRLKIIQIQQKLRKWIGPQQTLILSKFLELMKMIAPHISTSDATEMFNSVDRFHDGEIQTKVLLHDDFLPRMILKAFDDDYDSYDDDLTSGNDMDPHHAVDGQTNDDNAPYLQMNKKQLYEETKRLKKWIEEQGVPAMNKAEALQLRIAEYEKERNSTIHIEAQRQQRLKLDLLDLKAKFTQQASSHHLLAAEREEIIEAAQETQKRWETLQNALDSKDKELKRYKRLTEQLQLVNDKYLKRNSELIEVKQKLEEETMELRSTILSYHTAAEQYAQEQQIAMESMQQNMMELQEDLDAKEVAANVAANDLSAIFFEPTITITRDNLENNNLADMMMPATSPSMTGGGTGGHISTASAVNIFANNDPKGMRPLQYHYSRGSMVGGAGGLSIQPTFKHRTSYTLENVSSNPLMIKKKSSSRYRPYKGDIMEDDDGGDSELDENDITNITQLQQGMVIVDESYKDMNPEQDPIWMQKQNSQSHLTPRAQHRHQHSLSADLSGLIQNNQMMSGDLYGHHGNDRMSDEMKKELKSQIRQELMENYELKMQQKDIEHRIKLNKQQEKIEQEKEELIAKYEGLIKQYEHDLAQKTNGNGRGTNLKSLDERFLFDVDDVDDDYKIQQKTGGRRGEYGRIPLPDRASIDCNSYHKPKSLKDRSTKSSHSFKSSRSFNSSMEKSFNWNRLIKKIEKLFDASTLLWSFPLIK